MAQNVVHVAKSVFEFFFGKQEAKVPDRLKDESLAKAVYDKLSPYYRKLNPLWEEMDKVTKEVIEKYNRIFKMAVSSQYEYMNMEIQNERNKLVDKMGLRDTLNEYNHVIEKLFREYRKLGHEKEYLYALYEEGREEAARQGGGGRRRSMKRKGTRRATRRRRT
jgi:hypothetical protein